MSKEVRKPLPALKVTSRRKMPEMSRKVDSFFSWIDTKNTGNTNLLIFSVGVAVTRRLDISQRKISKSKFGKEYYKIK